MGPDRRIETVDTHTAGEPTRIVVDGLPAGATDGGPTAVRDRLRTELDDVRWFLMHEPRGHRDMFGAVVVEPTDDAADVGCVFMNPAGTLDMCVHGLIGVVTHLIEDGRVDPPGEEALVVETPAGLVRAWPDVEDGSVVAVTVQNVDSFVLGTAAVSVQGIELEATVAYAGNTFALVDVNEVGLAVTPEDLDELIDLALDIRTQLNETQEFHHPGTDEPLAVELVEWHDESSTVPANATVFGDGQVDRSPCGTGTCAKMATLFDRGELKGGEPYPYESVIGTRFTGEILATADRFGRTVVSPCVTGSAYIVARSTFVHDPADPLTGFRI